MEIKNKILELNTRNGVVPSLSEWFNNCLDEQIRLGIFSDNREQLKDALTKDLIDYKNKYNLENVVLGMSGGIDSALTAALFKNAGWNVTGVTMPVHQNEEETDRGVEACESLGIDHVQVDLSDTYDFYLKQNNSDKELSGKKESKDIQISKTCWQRGEQLQSIEHGGYKHEGHSVKIAISYSQRNLPSHKESLVRKTLSLSICAPAYPYRVFFLRH